MIYANVYPADQSAKKSFTPAMARGDEETKNFAICSNTEVPNGGVSIALDPETVAVENLDSVIKDLSALRVKILRK